MEQSLIETIEAQPGEARWSFEKKYFLRFACIYIFLYIFPFPFSEFAFLNGEIFFYYNEIWHIAVQWTGENILHLPYTISVFPNGSGDTTYNYVQVFVFFTLSVIFALIWTYTDKKRNYDKKISYWLLVFVRYYLGFTLLSYGFAKVFKTQFPFPNDMRLTETYGQSSPMGLLWTFMGYSPAYNYFTGGAEVLAGVLLFFRRTVTYGSLVAITVLSNIVIINFCYDVPVKLFSLHLLLMAVLILSFDIDRVVKFFFLNKAVPPAEITPIFANKSYRRAAFVIKVALICFFMFITIKMNLGFLNRISSDKSLLMKGGYEVEDFTENNTEVRSGIESPYRWKFFYIAPEAGYVSIRTENDSLQYFTYSQTDKTINIKTYSYPNNLFAYNELEPGKIVLTGTYKTDSLKLTLRKMDGSYNLVNRGFHWINEYPFNR